jgi:hypothetical protein
LGCVATVSHELYHRFTMTANPNEAACWCASDGKCPHPVSAKIASLWEELEQSVDDVLGMFDRKSMQNFLKRDLDGNPVNGGGVGRIKDVSVYVLST